MFNFFRNSLSGSSTQQTEECLLCLEVLDPRGGKQITCPGCCGKFFHQECVNQMLAAGNTSCPHCRKSFPNTTPGVVLPVTPNVPTIIPVANNPPPPARQSFFSALSNRNAPPQQQQQQIQQQQYSLPPQPIFLAPYQTSRVSKHPSHAYSNEEELLDPEALEAATKASNDKNGDLKKAGGNEGEGDIPITMSLQPERTTAPIAEIQSFFVNIKLKAPMTLSSSAEAMPRTAMDLVCVLDNSGSMSGSKLASVKEAMRFIRSQLTPADRLSVAYFNSNAQTMHGLRKMTDANKQSSGDILDGLDATGGTDIFAGMNEGFQTLFKRRTSNRLSCLFLLTDGQDSSRMEEKRELGQKIKALGYSFSCFGFGSDHDSEQLKMIANAAEGTFTYIEENSMVVDAFGGTLGGQQSMIGRNIRLTVSLFDHVSAVSGQAGAIVQVVSGKYQNTIANNKATAEVIFSNMLLGEVRDVLVKVKLPASAPSQLFSFISTQATYSNIHDIQINAVADSTCPFYKPEHPLMALCFIERTGDATVVANAVVDVEVDAQKNRVEFIETVEQANKEAERGDFEQAETRLKDYRKKVQDSKSVQAGNVLAASILEDLDESANIVKDKKSYMNRGGKAMMEEWSDNYAGQRVMYKKANKAAANNLYQNVSSVQVQQQAFFSKPSSK